MMKIFFVSFALLLAAIANGQDLTFEKLWAVLVAGSNTWGNYRHQADVCHAYQILHDHGIPDEQIIVFMYDDIAYNEENPNPGVIINNYNGPNVYEGVLKDYTGEDVTPENFLNVLLGNEEAMSGIGSGKVLKSGPKDHVFINFVDHGAFGLVAFPYSELYSSDLVSTLQQMYDDDMYAKLTFYLEACESGSMFLSLPVNISVYATTASGPYESSYACRWDEDLGTYLGDVYSVNWMDDSDDENLRTESLDVQFERVRNLTTTSKVSQYGDLSIDHLVVGQFQGMAKAPEVGRESPKPPVDAVPADEVPLEILKRKLESAKTEAETLNIRHQIIRLLENRTELKKTVKAIVKETVQDETKVAAIFNTRLEFRPNSEFCYETVVKHFSKTCFPLSQNNYALRHLPIFANMCEMKLSPEKMMAAMNIVCTRPITGIH